MRYIGTRCTLKCSIELIVPRSVCFPNYIAAYGKISIHVAEEKQVLERTLPTNKLTPSSCEYKYNRYIGFVHSLLILNPRILRFQRIRVLYSINESGSLLHVPEPVVFSFQCKDYIPTVTACRYFYITHVYGRTDDSWTSKDHLVRSV